MTEMIPQSDAKDRITPKAYRLVALWAAGILLLYAIGGYMGIRQLQCYKAETEKLRQAMIGAATTEQVVPLTKSTLPAKSKPVDVHVGIYINRMGEFAVKESAWAADFDIWFRWSGEGSNRGIISRSSTARLTSGTRRMPMSREGSITSATTSRPALQSSSTLHAFLSAIRV